MEGLDPKWIGLVIVVASLGGIALLALIYFLRNRISWVSVSRSGVQVSTNDVLIMSGVVDNIGCIDTATRKSVRKGSTGLMILDPKKYEMSDASLLANMSAVQLLINAAHENHHTREIDADGGDLYIQDKINDLVDALRVFKKQFPELTKEKIESFVCFWMRKVLLPSLRRACNEKITYYTALIARNDVSNTLKELVSGYQEKNTRYVTKIDALAERTDIKEKSVIFYNPL